MGFFGIVAAIGFAGAAAVWWLGTIGKILGIVASVLVGGALFWMVFGLAYPASVMDFVPGVLLPLGVVTGLGGSAAAIVAKRRGRTGATRAETRIVVSVFAIAVLAAVASGILSVTSRTSVEAPAGAVTSEMRDFVFAEGTYTVAAGQPATIVVHNADPVTHDFTIPELGISQVVLPGSDAAIELAAPPGTYTIYCTLHSDTSVADPAQAGMAATLVAS